MSEERTWAREAVEDAAVGEVADMLSRANKLVLDEGEPGAISGPYPLTDFRAALDRLLALVEAEARPCTHNHPARHLTERCREFIDRYEHSEAKRSTSWRAFACGNCKMLKAAQEAVRAATGGA